MQPDKGPQISFAQTLESYQGPNKEKLTEIQQFFIDASNACTDQYRFDRQAIETLLSDALTEAKSILGEDFDSAEIEQAINTVKYAAMMYQAENGVKDVYDKLEFALRKKTGVGMKVPRFSMIN